MTSQPPSQVRPPPPVAELALFGTAHPTHRLSRGTVTVDGIVYRLLVAVPRAAPAADGYPILYLLDGNAAFDLMSPAQLAAADGIVLAGIAHDTDRRFDPPSRSRDFTPGSGGPVPDPARPDREIGGAAPFLRRLCGPIRAAAEEGLAVDPARRGLFGHSLAGLFALYALLSEPDSFRQVAAASPSIWWGDEAMLRLEAAAPVAAARQRVLVTLGDSERRSSPAGPHWDGPAPHTLEMIRRLRLRPNLTVAAHVFPGAGHAATLEASLPLLPAFVANGPRSTPK